MGGGPRHPVRCGTMNFLGVGPLEVALVAIVAVIVLGPERIPAVAVQLARAVRYMRGYATDATADIRKELQELTREYDEVRKELNEFRSSVGSGFSNIADEVDRTLRAGQEKPRVKTSGEAPIIEPGGEPPPKTSGRSPRS
jgi:sec-independent protein translocase protein TatB